MVSASLSLGATPLETFFRVTLPVIAPGMTSGALLELDLPAPVRWRSDKPSAATSAAPSAAP